MKGIILAGGHGSRLFPVTRVVSKQLLAVYDKPMIYYPLSVLMLSGIREILVISTPADIPRFQDLLGDGSQWGIRFSYKIQNEPKGIADAFIVGKEFIGNDAVCLILGDNIFYGQGFQPILLDVARHVDGACIFGYWVNDPERYGVVEFDNEHKVVDLVEKPVKPRSNYAVPGLYYYDNDVIGIAENLKPSKRGELEITDLNREYLRRGKLKVKLLGRGFAWLDTGTHESLLEAGLFIANIEKRQGLKIACIEEVAYRMGYIDEHQIERLALQLMNNSYGEYLMRILRYEIRGAIVPDTF